MLRVSVGDLNANLGAISQISTPRNRRKAGWRLVLEGMACVRSGQASAWPLISNQSGRRGVTSVYLCQAPSHTPVALCAQSRLGLGVDTNGGIYGQNGCE
jgi:hypothetical protein